MAFNLSQSQVEIKQELSKTIAILGGKSDILSIIGDWSDLSDETILEQLQTWNKTSLESLNNDHSKLLEFCNKSQPY